MPSACDTGHRTFAGGAITIAPLRDGDVRTVRAVVEQLGAGSRHRRFGKPRLRPSDLALLAAVGDGRCVLVARAGGRPVGLAHLVRDGDPSAAEAALLVADEWQGIGIGKALARRLAAAAAAAGISRVHALVGADNRASLALMHGQTRVVARRFEGRDVFLVGEVGERRPAAGACSGPASRPSRRARPRKPRVAC